MTRLRNQILTACFIVAFFQAKSQGVLHQGTLSFEFVSDSNYITAVLSQWDSLAIQCYQAGLYEHIDSAKAAVQRVKAKELAHLKDREVIEYTFIPNKVGALAYRNTEKPYNFTLYDFDSLTIQINAVLNEKILLSKFSLNEASDAWEDEQNVVSQIDSSVIKEILGFKCVKYHFRHSHRVLKTNELVQFDFEMYVTPDIDFPLPALLPMCHTSPFKGCPLEYTNIVNASHKITHRAAFFTPQVDWSKFEAPTHLGRK